PHNRQHPGPQGGKSVSQRIGSDGVSARGSAGTLSSRSRCSLRHSGQANVSPLNTSVSNVWEHFRQAYS
ncbi:MAG TPA: hypothetical protein VGG61_08120, partial [Gemmataceae bacterium]